MDERIVETAGQYQELAMMLAEPPEEENGLDDETPDYIQSMLLRLYDVKALEAKMEKCEELLSEDTDGETVDKVMAAARTVEEASDSVFGFIEKYSTLHGDFEKKVEGITMDSDGAALDDLLYKLYKCEGIIRMAYRCATRYPTYGLSKSIMGGPHDTEVVTDEEAFISDEMNVDIYALLEIRDKLLAAIEPLAGKRG